MSKENGCLIIKECVAWHERRNGLLKTWGAVLFGLKAPVIKTHGATGPDAVRYTIRQIHTMLETQVVPQLVEYYEGKAE